MKAILDNLFSIIRKKSPKKLKELLTNSKNPENILIHIKNKKDGSIGYYKIDTNVPILHLTAKNPVNSKSILANSLNTKDLFKLFEEGNITIEDITTK